MLKSQCEQLWLVRFRYEHFTYWTDGDEDSDADDAGGDGGGGSGG